MKLSKKKELNNLKKIIIFFPIFNKGGIENIACDLINFFLKKNIKVDLITFKKNKYLNIKHKNLKILVNKKYQHFNFYNFIKVLFCTKKLISILKINNTANCAVLSMQNSVPAIIFSKFYGYNITVKNAAPIKAFLYGNYLKHFINFFLKIIFYNFANKIIVNSENNKKTLSVFIFNKQKIYKIFNPIKLNVNKKNLKRKNIILYVGRIVKEKGLDLLIDAFKLANLKNYKLFLVGDGSYSFKLKQKIKNLNLEKDVIFKGWVRDPNEFYLISKVLVLPTYFEGFGNVLIEAMNCGLPCIATKNSGGPDEILNNGKYGYLFKKNDINDLKKKITLTLKNKSDVKKKIRIAKKNLNRFNSNSCFEDYLTTISKL